MKRSSPGLRPMFMHCKCGKSFRYKTNAETETITHSCLDCQGPCGYGAERERHRLCDHRRERWKAMKDILYGLGAVLLLALMVIWGLALALAGPALLKFCILYLFG